MKKPQRFSFIVPLYEKRVYVVTAATVEEALDVLPAALHDASKEGGDHSKCRAIFLSDDPEYALIFLHNQECDMSILAHECGHLCRQLMNDIGFRIKANNDEPLAYLEAFVTKKLHAIFRHLKDFS